MDEPGLVFGPFRFDGANGILLRDGEPLPVGRRAMRVLGALLMRRGEVLTKAELLDAAWPEVTVEESNLHVQIASLRKALGPGPGGGEWIVTIPRVGYRMVPDKMSDTDEPAAGFAAARPRRGGFARWFPERHRGGLNWVSAAFFLIVAAAAIGSVIPRAAEEQPMTAEGTTPVVAVLPFGEIGGDPALAYFGDGISGDIIAMLTRVPDLTVVARSSSFRFGKQAVDVRQIGDELGVTHVVEGSFRKEADRLRIVAQLTDAGTGRQMWAERFDRTGADPWELQDEVTRKIVAALAGTAGTISLQQYRDAWGKDSANLEEYDYVLRVLSRVAAGTPESAAQAEAVLAEGLSRFPASSLLKAQAASTAIWRFARGWSDSEDPLEEIRGAGALARDALSDPAASPMLKMNAHISLAYAHLAERRHGQAVAEAEAAMALSPYDGRIVYYLAEIPIVAGRPEQALAWIERAAALYQPDDPRQQELSSMKAYALLRASGPAAALDVLESIRSSDAIVLRTTYLLRAIALVMLDRLDEARLEIGTFRDHDPAWTLARHRKRFFYADPASLEAAIRALALAGLPEN